MKRLFLHCGPPKTGTSAIQTVFWLHRDRLLSEFGILYPQSVEDPRQPKHVFLQRELIHDLEFQGLRRTLEEAERTHAHTVVISSEGLTSQSYLFDRSRTLEFRNLTRDWHVEFIFVTREKAVWLTSRYRQHILNPPQPRSARRMEGLHGTGLPFDAWVRISDGYNLIDDEEIRARFQSFFGQVPMTFIRYGPNVVNDVLAAVGVDEDIGADEAPYINTAPPDAYVEVLRRINSLPNRLRLNDAARAAIRCAVGSNHLQLAQRREPGRASLILLAATLRILKWSPNPILDVTPRSFDKARSSVAKAALKMAAGRGMVHQPAE